jgi:ubiquinone/menaquinone biosynthesis C-methylase UbiE
MNHQDHVELIKNGVEKGGIWADLGSGEGAFTLALRDRGGEAMEIYSIDKDANSLKRQKEQFQRMFPNTRIHYREQDFTDEIHVPKLDGIVMANSLHYVSNQELFLRKIRMLLKPQGKLLLVEYNTNTGNQWVPYPVSFAVFEHLAEKTGFEKPTLLGRVPSDFLHEIYAAVTRSVD